MGNDNSTIYDDVLRTIQERHPQLLIPLFNEVFHTSYPENADSEEKIRELLLEYQEIIEQLDAAEEMKQEGLMQDMIRLIRRIADYQLRRERELRERMDKVMGGKVLELPSDKLREEREIGIEALVETCMEFGASREDTEERIKTKFKLTSGRAQEYMQKYWK